MASLTIKDIPPDLLEQLKARAETERRSLTQEVIMLLSEGVTAGSAQRPGSSRAEQVAAWRALAGQWRSDLTVEEEISSIFSARTTGRKVDW